MLKGWSWCIIYVYLNYMKPHGILKYTFPISYFLMLKVDAQQFSDKKYSLCNLFGSLIFYLENFMATIKRNNYVMLQNINLFPSIHNCHPYLLLSLQSFLTLAKAFWYLISCSVFVTMIRTFILLWQIISPHENLKLPGCTLCQPFQRYQWPASPFILKYLLWLWDT